MAEASATGAGLRIWSVGALVGAVGAVLEHDFFACAVTGEVSGFSRAGSGHCYFNLKDPVGGASIRCAMFRRAAALLAFAPRDGQTVEVRGRVAVYEPRGELQFVVEGMLQGGAGALYERFLRVRATLEAEGLFDPAAKRGLPAHPRTVGVVTSLGGAALHDVATTLARRSPHVSMVVYPSVVQGTDAPASICAAIVAASRHGAAEVLIVCRGGGSLEDLWAFNDERVVRAIRAAPMPVLSGIGHETDTTLADLAADMRAATPTAAAELVAPARSLQCAALDAIHSDLARRIGATLDTQTQRLDRLGLLMARPGEGVRRRADRLARLAERLRRAPVTSLARPSSTLSRCAGRLHHAHALALARASARLEGAAARLQASDPARALTTGYALLTDAHGRAVTSVEALAAGMRVSARLADGEASMTVTSRRRRP